MHLTYTLVVMQFYFTAGRGTEQFLRGEIVDTFSKQLKQVDVGDGKVFIKLSDGSVSEEKVTALNSAERAFVQVYHGKSTSLNQSDVISSIKELLSEKQVWNGALNLWHRVNKTQSQNVTDSQLAGDVEKAENDSDEPLSKKPRVDVSTGFRMSCKCSGKYRRLLPPQVLSRKLGLLISQLMNWQIELRRPLFEVCLHINDSDLIVGIPLTSCPLSKRVYLKHFGLRSTIAWIMTYLLNIQPNDKILDPMCGKATILVEAARHWTCEIYLGCDKDPTQLQLAQENIHFATAEGLVQLIQGDAKALPFAPESIDKVVTDAPFGKKHTTNMDIRNFYHCLLTEIRSVLKPGGRFVLLTSTDLKQCVVDFVDAQEKSITENKERILDKKSACNASSGHSKGSQTGISDDSGDNQIAAVCAMRENQHENEHTKCSKQVNIADHKILNQNDVSDNKKLNHTDILDHNIVENRTEISILEGDNPTYDEISDRTAISNLTEENADKRLDISDQRGDAQTGASVYIGDNHGEVRTSPVRFSGKYLKRLTLEQTHYVKLGDTDAYIMVINKEH